MVTQQNQQGIYRVQHGGKETTMVVEASSKLIVNGALDITSGQLTMPGALALGYLDLTPQLFTARETASAEKLTSGTSAPTYFWGGLLLPDTTPLLNLLSTADPIMYYGFASAVVDSLALPPVAMPRDLATAGGLIVELYGEVVGTASAADAVQAFKINARMGIGDVEMGATHPNFTSSPSWQGITITSGNLTTDQLNLMLTPQTHAARQINLYGARGRYTKLTS